MAIIDLIDGRLPLPVGGGANAAAPPGDVDVIVENIPLWLAVSGDNPYQRQTAQFKREQVDQQPEAGEQSLQAWWLRSQMTWHFGSGLRYLDTMSGQADPVDRARFHDSRGVDPWTPGVIRRLNGTTRVLGTTGNTPVWVKTTLLAGVEYVVMASGTTVKYSVNKGSTWTSVSYGSANPILAFCIDGANFYAATVDGVWKNAITGGTATQLYANTTGTGLLLGWSKLRLVFCVGAAVYLLNPNIAAGANVLPTVQYTFPQTGWVCTAVCDTPKGIGVAGYAGLYSCVVEFQLIDNNGTPVVGSGLVYVTLPSGEIVNDAIQYMGSMLCLATNRGVRISIYQSYWGTITLGPLVQLVGDGVQMNCTTIAGYDRFIYAGTVVDGLPGLLRIDLSNQEDQSGHYPWATDLQPPVSPVTAAGQLVNTIAMRQDGTKYWGVAGYGVISENTAPDNAQPAWFSTARIRMGTVEDKHWVHGIVRSTATLSAPVLVETQTAVSPWVTAFSVTDSGTRFDLTAPKGEWIQLRFTLQGNVEFNSYVVQALPGGTRQRMVTVPVELFDYVTTRSGMKVGYDGWALERLAALEDIEAGGGLVTLAAPALFPEALRGVIEQLQFSQSNDPGDRETGTGGVLLIQMRVTT